MARGIVAEAAHVVCSFVARTKPLQKAAVLLNCLTPETVMEVSRALGERDVNRLLSEMTRLPSSVSVETLLVVHEFFRIHRLENALGGIPDEPRAVVATLECWAARNPRRLGRLLKDSWLSPRD